MSFLKKIEDCSGDVLNLVKNNLMVIKDIYRDTSADKVNDGDQLDSIADIKILP